jgi:hypothetical protein
LNLPDHGSATMIRAGVADKSEKYDGELAEALKRVVKS